MGRKHILLATVATVMVLLLFACSDKGAREENTNGSSELNNEIDEVPALKFTEDDVVLKVATPWGEDYFMSRIGDFVQEIKPHMTLEHVAWDGTVQRLEELFAENVVPDVLLAYTGQSPLQELDVDFALDDMLAAYQIDPEIDLKIPDFLLDEIRSRDPDNGLIGIPQERSFYGLYYQKEVFDRFGIPYPDPEVGMTWEEVINIAKQMTTTRDGINYCGLQFDRTEMVPLRQLSVNSTDPETGEVLYTSDPKFTKFMEMMDSYYSIPGILDESCGMGEKNLGMLIAAHGFIAQTWMGGETVEDKIKIYEPIDVLPIPTWSDQPGVGPTPSGVIPWVINSYSEQKDAALEFIFAGVSQEYQLYLAKDGTPSILQVSEVIEEFGANNPVLEGKNVRAFFADKPATPPDRKGLYDNIIPSFPIIDFEEGDMDIQHFLRVAQEEAEIHILEYETSQ